MYLFNSTTLVEDDYNDFYSGFQGDFDTEIDYEPEED